MAFLPVNWLKQWSYGLYSQWLGDLNNSNNSAEDMHSTFETMFPDSAIASSFQLDWDKLKYMTNWGIAPFVKDWLRNNIDKAEYVVVSFDESLNHTTQSCQMDLLLRYWDNHDQQVKVRYWDSKFLMHTTNKNMLMKFNKSVDIINLSKIMQVSWMVHQLT